MWDREILKRFIGPTVLRRIPFYWRPIGSDQEKQILTVQGKIISSTSGFWWTQRRCCSRHHSQGALRIQMDRRSCPQTQVGWLSPFQDLWPRQGVGRPELLLSFVLLRNNKEEPGWSRGLGCGRMTIACHSHVNQDAKLSLNFVELCYFRKHLPSLKSLFASSKTSVSLLLDGHSMSSRFSESNSKLNQQSANI